MALTEREKEFIKNHLHSKSVHPKITEVQNLYIARGFYPKDEVIESRIKAVVMTQANEIVLNNTNDVPDKDYTASKREDILEYLNEQSLAIGKIAVTSLYKYFNGVGIKQREDDMDLSSAGTLNNTDLTPTNAPLPETGPDKRFSKYLYSNVSFSGCDIVVTAQLRINNADRPLTIGSTKATKLDKQTDGSEKESSIDKPVDFVTLGSLQTMTYSVFDKMNPIHSIGNVNAKDYVHSHRTIAGTMIFAVFNKHWAKQLINAYKINVLGLTNQNRKILIDELPPIDLTISMANEYGAMARLALYGVRFYNEGMTMSINDVYTENTFQFVATNIDYLEDLQDKETFTTVYKSTGENPPDIPEIRNPNPSGDPKKEEDEDISKPYTKKSYIEDFEIRVDRGMTTAEIDKLIKENEGMHYYEFYNYVGDLKQSILSKIPSSELKRQEYIHILYDNVRYIRQYAITKLRDPIDAKIVEDYHVYDTNKKILERENPDEHWTRTAMKKILEEDIARIDAMDGGD